MNGTPTIGGQNGEWITGLPTHVLQYICWTIKKLTVHETKFSIIARRFNRCCQYGRRCWSFHASFGDRQSRVYQIPVLRRRLLRKQVHINCCVLFPVLCSFYYTILITHEEYVPVKADKGKLKVEAATVEAEAAGLKEQLQVQKGGRPLGKYRVFTTRIGRTDVRGRPKQWNVSDQRKRKITVLPSRKKVEDLPPNKKALCCGKWITQWIWHDGQRIAL